MTDPHTNYPPGTLAGDESPPERNEDLREKAWMEWWELWVQRRRAEGKKENQVGETL